MTLRSLPTRIIATAAFVLLAGAPRVSAQQKCPALKPGELPLKYRGGPTLPAITPCDLMTRLYIYADDSMMGRRVGTDDNRRATDYIEHEVRRLGLVPGGDAGGYFQNLPVFMRSFDATGSTIEVGGTTFRGGADFTANVPTPLWNKAGAAVVFGGTANDTINPLSAGAVQGKILVLRVAPASGRGTFFGRPRGPVSPARQAYQAMLGAAAAVMTIAGDQLPGPDNFGGFAGAGRASFRDPAQQSGFGGGGVTITATTRVADALFGRPLDALARGTDGKNASLSLKFDETPVSGRNVVAILPGSDPRVKGEYVAIGAHNDHIGFNHNPVDHDSLRAYDIVARPQGADSRGAPPPTTEQWTRINAMIDSMRKLHPARADSIDNGADDDGSGTVSVLEIAEALAKAKVKPKRSIVFVWHTGEESGLWGSQWFTNHPSVPRDSIVAQLNLDMVGRGEASDVTGVAKDRTPLSGGPGYVQLVGSRRLSTELGDLVEQVNAEQKLGIRFDYGEDADGHPQNIYCRSDHANYARYGIPVTFFTTGGHADYHQVTDEPEYIQYRHMAKVDSLVYATALKVANLDHRVVVDKPKPESPFGRCVQ